MKWLVTVAFFVNFFKILDSNNTNINNTELCTKDEDCHAGWSCIQTPTGSCICGSQARLADSYCQGIVFSEEIDKKLPTLRRSRRQVEIIVSLSLLIILICICCVICACAGLCCFAKTEQPQRYLGNPPCCYYLAGPSQECRLSSQPIKEREDEQLNQSEDLNSPYT